MFTFHIIGEVTHTHDSWAETDKMILDKVLSDERSTAYATTIEDINIWYSECKECNWYKSKQSIFSEARFSICTNHYNHYLLFN